MTKENQIITSVAKPLHPTVIENNIDEIVDQVKNEIAALKINDMEVSEDNKQTLKKTRTKLNNRLSEFETERKKIKEFVLQPYADFETLYDSKLKTVIKDAITDLDLKIKSIEEGQKKDFENYGREYFNRKLSSQPLTVANKFEDAKVDISLSTNNKKIRESIDAHFDKILNALTIINAHDHPARLQVLWEKNNYDIGTAMVKLATALQEEKKLADKLPDVSSMHSKQIVDSVEKNSVTKVPEVIEKKPQLIPAEAFDFKLNITVTESQLAALTTFMEEEDIIFELSE